MNVSNKRLEIGAFFFFYSAYKLARLSFLTTCQKEQRINNGYVLATAITTLPGAQT